MHPKSIRVPLNCAACGVRFERKPSELKRSRSGLFFCSNPCKQTCRTVMAPPEEKACATCGAVFSVSGEQRSRLFCTIQCSNRRNYVEQHRTCRQCQRDFTLGKGRVEASYCSRECWNASIKAKPHVCPQCNVAFTSRQANARYCSPACQALGRRRRVSLACTQCGRDFEVGYAVRSRRKHCSRRCMRLSMFNSGAESDVIDTVAAILEESPQRHRTFPWLRSNLKRPLHVDAYFPNANLALEFDGAHHRHFVAFYHKTPAVFAAEQERDKLKAELLEANGIRLLRVQDNEPHQRADLESRISAMR